LRHAGIRRRNFGVHQVSAQKATFVWSAARTFRRRLCSANGHSIAYSRSCFIVQYRRISFALTTERQDSVVAMLGIFG
jgi:hypothetical protein